MLKTYEYHVDGSRPFADEVFVFGSNLAGRHGAGAAKAAVDFYGAKYGVGVGLYGNSYAIPTVSHTVRESLPLEEIAVYVKHFVAFTHYIAEWKPDMRFFVTRLGCVLAGYENKDIAPMFKGCNTNCNFPEEWMEFLED